MWLSSQKDVPSTGATTWWQENKMRTYFRRSLATAQVLHGPSAARPKHAVTPPAILPLYCTRSIVVHTTPAICASEERSFWTHLLLFCDMSFPGLRAFYISSSSQLADYHTWKASLLLWTTCELSSTNTDAINTNGAHPPKFIHGRCHRPRRCFRKASGLCSVLRTQIFVRCETISQPFPHAIQHRTFASEATN